MAAKEAIEATNRRFNQMLREAHDHYRIEIERIEKRRLNALGNVQQSEAFADYMIEHYGKKE